MLHGNYYADRLGPEITRDMALWVRQEDPAAVLFLNDYDILTGKRLNDYVVQIQRLLDQGVPVGGIGVQGHFHGDSFDPDALKSALDRLAQFKLPIRVTEFNFPGQQSKYYGDRGARLTDEEEQAKAEALVDYYRICFANPAVEGILMWGFWEGANWIPVSSLYRRELGRNAGGGGLPGSGVPTMVDQLAREYRCRRPLRDPGVLRQVSSDRRRQRRCRQSEAGRADQDSLI